MDNLKIDSDDEVSVWNPGQNDKVVLQSEDEDDSMHSESEDSGINLVQINPYFLSSKISGDTWTFYDFQMESHVDKATEEFFAFEDDNIYNSLDECLNDTMDQNGEMFPLGQVIHGQKRPARKGLRQKILNPSCLLDLTHGMVKQRQSPCQCVLY